MVAKPVKPTHIKLNDFIKAKKAELERKYIAVRDVSAIDVKLFVEDGKMRVAEPYKPKKTRMTRLGREVTEMELPPRPMRENATVVTFEMYEDTTFQAKYTMDFYFLWK